MDLRQLKYFIAVAEERNFGRAAARLHVSQPPITRQIKMLEDDLGVLLFDRTHWGVQLTQAGKVLLSNAYGIRALVDHAWDRTRRVGSGIAGRLDVGLFGSGMLTIIPEILRRYSSAHPEVEVVLLNAPQNEQLDALRQERVLIIFDRHLPDDPDLVVELVAREPQVLALHESNPLAQLGVVPLEMLFDQPMIMARDARHAGRTTELCRASGFDPRVGQKAADMISGLVMVANGMGVHFVPESAQVLQLPGLVYRPMKFRNRGDGLIDLQCAYRRNETSPLVAAILDIVRDYRAEKESTAAQTSGRRARRKS